MKDPLKVKQGKKYKRAGMLFENKVRADLENKNWIVDRWSNQVEFGHTATLNGDFKAVPSKDLTLKNGKHYPGPVGKLVKAKSNRFNMRTCGFPDFIAFKRFMETKYLYKLIGVEVKIKGKLSKEEKEKCAWYLENNIFAKIFIASKRRDIIVYEEFKSKHTQQTQEVSSPAVSSSSFILKNRMKEIENLENTQFHKASVFRGNVKVMVKSNVKDYGNLNFELGFEAGQKQFQKEIKSNQEIFNHSVRTQMKELQEQLKENVPDNWLHPIMDKYLKKKVYTAEDIECILLEIRKGQNKIFKKRFGEF